MLPNYALIDSVTQLDATLYWQEGENPRTGKAVFKSLTRGYERPRRFAISELAPGNTFYANGYRHEITGLEIGSAAHPARETWRVCPSCGYVRTENAETDRTRCPRCGTGAIADDGSCLHRVVQPTVVTSRDKREDARIRDDRDPRFYEVVDFKARRAGRGRPLTRPERHAVWKLIEQYTARLDKLGVETWSQAAERAARFEIERASRVLARKEHKDQVGGRDLIHRDADSGMRYLNHRYRHIVVDEAQDLSPAHWKMLRAMVAPGPNDMFIAGDTHQRIYDNQVSLGAVGVNIRGRASRLTLSYRTTREIHVGTMHRFKGLEYQKLAIVAVSDGILPRSTVIDRYRDADPVRYHREMRKARALLFVAATRVRDALTISWYGKRSRLLDAGT